MPRKYHTFSLHCGSFMLATLLLYGRILTMKLARRQDTELYLQVGYMSDLAFNYLPIGSIVVPFSDFLKGS